MNHQESSREAKVPCPQGQCILFLAQNSKSGLMRKLLMLGSRMRQAKEQPVLIFCKTTLHQSQPQITAVSISWNSQPMDVPANQSTSLFNMGREMSTISSIFT